MADNTVFDSVFKTMMHREPQLVIPFINEVFGRDYPDDTHIAPLNDEHVTVRGTKIDDSVFRLADRLYHVECQSTPDANMVIRMIEYDFTIAFEEALSSGAPYTMRFPDSCVLFLRHNGTTPEALTMRVELPDGHSFEYQTKVVKAQAYGSAEIFDKHLLLLLPYYLMRYEHELEQIDGDAARTDGLIAECAELRARLEGLTVANGNLLLYDNLVELIIEVSDHVLSMHEALRKRVRSAMGGEVLELMHDRAERMEREGFERGIERGLEEGIVKGREEGRVEGREEVIEKMRERGIDEQLVEEILASFSAPSE